MFKMLKPGELDPLINQVNGVKKKKKKDLMLLFLVIGLESIWGKSLRRLGCTCFFFNFNGLCFPLLFTLL